MSSVVPGCCRPASARPRKVPPCGLAVRPATNPPASSFEGKESTSSALRGVLLTRGGRREPFAEVSADPLGGSRGCFGLTPGCAIHRHIFGNRPRDPSGRGLSVFRRRRLVSRTTPVLPVQGKAGQEPYGCKVAFEGRLSGNAAVGKATYAVIR